MTTATIDDLLRDDHERLSGIFRRFRQSIGGNGAAAGREFRRFRRGLERHIAFEEEVLFPAMRRAGHPERSLDSLAADHEVIAEHLEAVQEALDSGDADRARRAAESLDIYLEGHNRDEEAGVYREAFRSLAAAEGAGLAGAFRAGRARPQETPP
jgi:hypothetical protein